MRFFLMTLTVFAVGVCGLSGRAGAQPQLGLRLDSRSSIQWEGNRLFMEGPANSYMELPVSQILDVSLGPVKGTFAVVHSKGIGMLLGSTLVPGAAPIESTAMVRSARPDALFACVSATVITGCNRIVEFRVGNQAREVATSSVAIRDFDVDVAGHIVILYEDDRLVLLTGAQPLSLELTSALRSALQRSRESTRVFIDASGSEIALYAGDLFRIDTKTRSWRSFRFNSGKDALVRHAVSRRIRLEERFSVRSQKP